MKTTQKKHKKTQNHPAPPKKKSLTSELFSDLLYVY